MNKIFKVTGLCIILCVATSFFMDTNAETRPSTEGHTLGNVSEVTTVADSLIQFAHNYLKTPYKRGGMSPKAFDCSGFSSFVYKSFGYSLNRSSCDQVFNGKEIEKTELKAGDLVFFKGRNAKQNRVGHVGIVVESDEEGNFKFIHASVKYGVTVNSGDQPYYKTRYVTARRVIEEHSANPYL